MRQLQTYTGPDNPWYIPVLNTTGESVPPHGVMQIVGATAAGSDTIYNITKPTGAANAKYIINSPSVILPGDYGAGTDRYPTDAAITGAPVVGSEFGPTLNFWTLTASGTGFLVVGGVGGGFAKVASKSSGGGQSADFPVIFLRNDSLLPRPAWSVFKTGVPLTPVPAAPIQPLFTTLAPVEGEPFAISFADVGVDVDNNIVAAAQIGPVLALVNFTDESHKKAQCITGDYAKLKSVAEGPATIIWREKQHIVGSATLGVQWCYVLLDRGGGGESSTHIIVRIETTIGARTGESPGSGSAQPVNPASLGEAVGGAVTVHNLSQVPIVGSSGSPVYWKASQIGGLYFLDTFDMKSVPQFASANRQIVGHDTNGNVEWKTVETKTINNPTAIDLRYASSTSIAADLAYQPIQFFVWPGTQAGASATFTDTLSGTECPT